MISGIWTPPKPAVLTPPRWVSRLSEAFARLRKSASSGHLLKNTSGHLAISCGVSCDELPGSSIDVTFDGVQLLACQSGETSRFGQTNINGTFQVDYDSHNVGNKTYTYFRDQNATFPEGPHAHTYVYEDPDCGGALISSSSRYFWDIEVTLKYGPSPYTLTAWAILNIDTNPTDSISVNDGFEFDGQDDCDESVDNFFDGTNNGSNLALYGGTASITAVNP